MPSPKINVTPLIDVLLVLLIIFMVVSPLKPSSFHARIPSEPRLSNPIPPATDTLVVTINSDLSLTLNGQGHLGEVDHPAELIELLSSVFDQRERNLVLDESGNVVKGVFIKAPRNIGYGNVAKVIDAVKIAGAEPLALQIDYLD